ncbi:MAG: class I SAM-dependent methyltransferase [Candidatus Peribacteraceae bacterium]
MKDTAYALSAAVESRHWWYQGRAAILSSLLQRFLPPSASVPRILDIGCGTGNDLQFLSRFGGVTGLDFHESAVAACRGLGFDVVQGDATALPFPDRSFDVVCSLDVLNGIREDGVAVAEAMRVLRPGGIFLVTAGAGPLLWGKTDVLSQHCRRYRRREFLALLGGEGRTILFRSHFNTFLFPLAFLARMAERLYPSHSDQIPGLSVPPFPFNGMLRTIFASERVPLRFFPLPFGVSIVAIVKKER